MWLEGKSGESCEGPSKFVSRLRPLWTAANGHARSETGRGTGCAFLAMAHGHSFPQIIPPMLKCHGETFEVDGITVIMDPAPTASNDVGCAS